MCAHIIRSWAVWAVAESQCSCSSGLMMTGVRFSSPDLWNCCITGCRSAFTVSMLTLTTLTVVSGSVHLSQSQAMAKGWAVGKAIRHRTALPVL